MFWPFGHKNISTYSPYNVTMHDVEPRRVLAPENKITTKNRQDVGHMNAKKHMKTPGRSPASASVPTGARMPATSRIPVSRAVWGELSGLRKPGETYDHLLEEMVEREKKRRLFEDMDRIEKSGKFKAMKW